MPGKNNLQQSSDTLHKPFQYSLLQQLAQDVLKYYKLSPL